MNEDTVPYKNILIFYKTIGLIHTCLFAKWSKLF